MNIRMFQLPLWSFAFITVALAAAQPFNDSEVIQMVTGKSTTAERKELGKLLVLMAKMSHTRKEMRLDNIAALTRTTFSEPFCAGQGAETIVCSYQNADWGVKTFAITNFRTFTKVSEADAGATLRMQIARDFACIPPSSMERFWGIRPIKGPIAVPDSFADNREAHLTITDLYRGINADDPETYVETKTVEGCVVEIFLSAHPLSKE